VLGSLVEKRRVCHTVGEWRRIHRDASLETQRVLEDGTIRPRGN
jgi:hypothetical protein